MGTTSSKGSKTKAALRATSPGAGSTPSGTSPAHLRGQLAQLLTAATGQDYVRRGGREVQASPLKRPPKKKITLFTGLVFQSKVVVIVKYML